MNALCVAGELAAVEAKWKKPSGRRKMSSFIEKNKTLLHRVYQTLAVGMFEGDKEACVPVGDME